VVPVLLQQPAHVRARPAVGHQLADLTGPQHHRVVLGEQRHPDGPVEVVA
jgi:hypothetical protein